jgi:hypothetical protein
MGGGGDRALHWISLRHKSLTTKDTKVHKGNHITKPLRTLWSRVSDYPRAQLAGVRIDCGETFHSFAGRRY